MKIFIANDHAGLSIKKSVINCLEDLEYPTVDLGCFDEASVDYPDYANKLADAMMHNTHSLGILICGSGIGMCISANRHKHIRAAVCTNKKYATLARSHNDANVLVLGARFLTNSSAAIITREFFTTQFAGGRHQFRVGKL